jgi:hypothetical protein
LKILKITLIQLKVKAFQIFARKHAIQTNQILLQQDVMEKIIAK